MLVPFALASEALLMNSGDLAQQRVIHKRFIEVWNEVGIFFHLEPFAKDSVFATAIAKLPQEIKKLWIVAIQQNRRIEISTKLKDLSNATQLSDIEQYYEDLKLACLDDVMAYCLGLPADCESIIIADKGLEICRFDFVDQSKHVRNALETSCRNIPKGEHVESVWANWFKVLATYCKKIVIVDRYALISNLERRDNKSGLCRFLTEIDKLPTQHNITIYSARNAKYTDMQLINKLRQHVDLLKNNGILTLNLNICDDGLFSETAHYRYIKFDNIMCEIDTGLEIFSGDNVFRTCTFNRKKTNALSYKEELALRGNSTHITIK